MRVELTTRHSSSRASWVNSESSNSWQICSKLCTFVLSTSMAYCAALRAFSAAYDEKFFTLAELMFCLLLIKKKLLCIFFSEKPFSYAMYKICIFF